MYLKSFFWITKVEKGPRDTCSKDYGFKIIKSDGGVMYILCYNSCCAIYFYCVSMPCAITL